MRRWVSDVDEVGELALNLRRNSHHLVAKPHVHRQVRPPSPVVLRVHTEERLTKAPFRSRIDISRRESRWLVGEKFGKCPEVKNTSGAGQGEHIRLQPLDSNAESQRVGPTRKKS